MATRKKGRIVVDAALWMKGSIPDRRHKAEVRIYGEYNAPPRPRRTVTFDDYVRPTKETRNAIRLAAKARGFSNHKLAHSVGAQTQHAFNATTRKPQMGVPRVFVEAMCELLGVEMELEEE